MVKSTRSQIKAEFFEFLRENNCASKFCVNFYNNEVGKSFRRAWGIHIPELSKYLNNITEETWIFDAFTWAEVPQSYNYWEKMHDKWNEQLQALKYNIQKSKDETNSH